MTISSISRIATLALALPLAAPAAAQDAAADYPNRPVTFIVPFAPGGVTGLFARVIGQKLEQRLGKPFVIDHRPGGGGITAAQTVARGAPDGYTIMMASSSILAIAATVRKELPYDPRVDLTPVALIARVPFVLVVDPALPIRSVDDLVALARAKPGALSYASPGPGTFGNLNGEMFKSRFGLNITQVSYRGTVPGLQDVAAGHVTLMFADVPPAVPLIEGGKLRALGVTPAARVAILPDVRPLNEVGMPGHDTASWHTITTTGGVPAPIVEKLSREIRAIMAEPDVRELFGRDGTLPQVSPPPDELKRFVSSEIDRWGAVVTAAGMAGSQ